MPEKASVLTLAQVVVASNAFELGQLGKEKQGMDSVMIAAFLDEIEKISADLTTSAREDIKTKNFAEPKKRKYPIEDPAHARNALARVSQFGSPAEKSQVRAKVHSKYPGIGEKEKDANYDPVGEAKGFAGVVRAAGALKRSRAAVTSPIMSSIPKLTAKGIASGVQRVGPSAHQAAQTVASGARAAKPAAQAGGSMLRKRLALGGAVGGSALLGHMLPQHHDQQQQAA